MNTYEITYKEDYYEPINSHFNDKGNGYIRNEQYYDIDGKIAYKSKHEYHTVKTLVKAVSEEGVRKMYHAKTIDEYGHPCRYFQDLKVKLLNEGDIHPFETLNKDFCMLLRGFEVINKEFIGNIDVFCSDEVQEMYSKIEDKEAYLNEYVVYDDQSHFAFGI